MATKTRREIEPRWVSEYVVSNYPNAEIRLRCPLGPAIAGLADQMGLDKALRVSRPWRPEADAVVVDKKTIVLIEGKIFRTMDGLSKLPTYKSLIPTTPELEQHKALPVEMQLLVVRPLPWVLEAAKAQGILVKEWAPPWIVQVWEERDSYWAPASVKAREERKKVLGKLGF